MRERVAIVVDSAASLPAPVSGNPLLSVVPMSLAIGDETYLDGIDLGPSDLYRILRDSDALPNTAAPSPAGFLQAFREASSRDLSVLCLTVGSAFSASFDSATAAVREAKEALPDLEISVLDTGTAAGGQGLVALEALRKANDGAELELVASTAELVMRRVRVIAVLDTLYYLWKGGRVPRIAHAATSALRIKPIFELAEGQVRTVARPRTHRRAVGRLLDLMRERVAGSGAVHVTVMHADAKEAADELSRRIEREFDCDELFVSEFTPVMSAHIGPGLVGTAFWAE